MSLYREYNRETDRGKIVPVMVGWFVPVTVDYKYLLDWAIDVGGDNYRPEMQEIIEVLDRVTGETS